ncbi:MAG TPA: hypothetical protein VLK33_13525, partial [Terriglobales bacterium]|nr:hypothetical protein [Terriglobales bacterium]
MLVTVPSYKYESASVPEVEDYRASIATEEMNARLELFKNQACRFTQQCPPRVLPSTHAKHYAS